MFNILINLSNSLSYFIISIITFASPLLHFKCKITKINIISIMKYINKIFSKIFKETELLIIKIQIINNIKIKINKQLKDQHLIQIVN